MAELAGRGGGGGAGAVCTMSETTVSIFSTVDGEANVSTSASEPTVVAGATSELIVEAEVLGTIVEGTGATIMDDDDVLPVRNERIFSRSGRLNSKLVEHVNPGHSFEDVELLGAEKGTEPVNC